MLVFKNNFPIKVFSIRFFLYFVSTCITSQGLVCLDDDGNKDGEQSKEKKIFNEDDPGFLNNLFNISGGNGDNKDNQKTKKSNFKGVLNKLTSNDNKDYANLLKDDDVCGVTLKNGKVISLSEECVDEVKDIVGSCDKCARHFFAICPSFEVGTLLSRRFWLIAGLGMDFRISSDDIIPHQYSEASIKSKNLSGLKDVGYLNIPWFSSLNAYLGVTCVINDIVSLSAACVFELHILKESTLYKCIVDREDENGDKKPLDTILFGNLGFFVRCDFSITKRISAYGYARCCFLVKSMDAKNCNDVKYKCNNLVVGAGVYIKKKMTDRVFIRGNIMGSWNRIRIDRIGS